VLFLFIFNKESFNTWSLLPLERCEWVLGHPTLRQCSGSYFRNDC